MTNFLSDIAELDNALDSVNEGLEEALSERPPNFDKIKKLAAMIRHLGEAQRIAKTSLLGHKGANNSIMSHIIR